MARRSLGLRLTVRFAAVFIAVVALTDALLFLNHRSVEFDRGADELRRAARLVALLADADRFNAMLVSNAAAGRAEAMWLSPHGALPALIRTAQGTNASPGLPADDEWLRRIALAATERAREAITSGRVAVVHATGPAGRRVSVWAAAAEYGNGTAVALSSLGETREAVRAFALQLIGISALIATVGFWTMLMVGADITRPVVLLTRAADRIADGDMEVRVGMERDDELGALLVTFDAMAARIREIETNRRRFLSDASHELRTPLASIKAVLDAVLAERSIPCEARAMLAAGDREVERMTGLVRALATLTRLEESHAHPQRVRVRDAATRLCTLLGPAARESGSTIHLAVPEELELTVDPDMLDELLLNLLDNALRHGGPDLEITVSATASELRVENSGLPIPPGLRTTLFQPFVSGDSSRSRRLAGGSGLGLAIVARIVREHGWTVRAESSIDATRFIVDTRSSSV